MSTTDPDIRLLTSADLDGAFGLSTGAGWNQRLADWRMLLQLAPASSFAAVANRRVVGTAIGIDYGTFGWIAMMLVDPAWRGRGIGGRLLEEAIGAVPPEIPLRLDATPLGRSLYERYGFQDEAELTRHIAEPSRLAVDPTCDLTARPVRGLTPVDLRSVIAEDDLVFGAHRRVLLEWALLGAAHYAHVIDTDAGVQYCFGRPGRLFDQIGPVVAADDETARLLVGASLREAAGRPVVVDAYDRHDEFTEWLQTRGFYASRPLFRMRRPARHGRGTRSAPPSVLSERAILGPEFG